MANKTYTVHFSNGLNGKLRHSGGATVVASSPEEAEKKVRAGENLRSCVLGKEYTVEVKEKESKPKK